MSSKYLINLVMLFLSLSAPAQQAENTKGKDLLMLFPANPLPETQMMTPFVKKLLENMNDGKKKGTRLFRSVSSSADYSRILSAEEMLMSNKRLLGERHDVEKLQTPERRNRDSLYRKLLNNFDQVLIIELIYRTDSNKTLIPPDHYLYYFTLQNVVNVPGNLPLADATSSASLLVKTGTDIRKALIRKLRELFPESNEPPVIRMISSLASYKGQYYCTPGDSVRFALQIKDADSDPYLFRYYWQAQCRSAVMPDFKNAFDSTQTIVLRDTGTICLLAQIHDEFSPSNIDTFRLHVISKPRIISVRNCYYVHIGKKNGVLTHPFDAMYQPYLFFDTTTTRLFNITEVYTNKIIASDVAINIEPVPSGGHIADSITAAAFFVYRNKGYVNILHNPAIHRPGVYDYQVRLLDHGVASAPVPLRLRYRKASPLYTQSGVFIGKYKSDKTAVLALTSGIGAFLHRYLMAEYCIEFPINDSLYGKGFSLRHANHRFSFLTPIPLKRTRGLVIAPELGIWLFHSPPYATEIYSGMNFGLNLKMLYSTYPWLGTCYRVGYTETRQLPGKPVKNGLFYMAFAVTIQPVSKKGKL